MKKCLDKLIHYMKQPYWGEFHPVYTTITATLLVLFVLAVFKPFGIAKASVTEYFLILFATTVGVVSGILIAHYLTPSFFKTYYARENWTVGKDIFQNIYSVFVIGITNGIAHVICQALYNDASLQQLLSLFVTLFFATLILSPIPVLVSTILNHNRALASTLHQAQELNHRLMTSVKDNNEWPENNPSLVLTGTTKETVTLSPGSILYIEACGNYVKINYREKEKNQQKMLRSTIKQVEDSLKDYPFIFRCHRAFLVNINYITKVGGNSRNHRLSLLHTTEEVPVSRVYTKTLIEQIG